MIAPATTGLGEHGSEGKRDGLEHPREQLEPERLGRAVGEHFVEAAAAHQLHHVERATVGQPGHREVPNRRGLEIKRHQRDAAAALQPALRLPCIRRESVRA